MDNTTQIVLIVILSVIAILIIYLLRELGCWYWKINERVKLQEKQIALLEKIADKLESD